LAQAGGGGISSLALLGIITAVVLLALGGWKLYAIVTPWLYARREGVDIGLARIARLHDPAVIIAAAANARKGGIHVSIEELQTHHLAGGRLPQVVTALILAKRANIEVTWDVICAVDLAGRDVLDLIRQAQIPITLDVPSLNSRFKAIHAVPQDGIELIIRAEVQCRLNAQRVIGGATEGTIIARVAEAVIRAVAASPTHQEALANMETLGDRIKQLGLDAGTAFLIDRIRITDVEIGEDVMERYRREDP
jgi:uncharacterized protein YqfA (UPF0365 family)